MNKELTVNEIADVFYKDKKGLRECYIEITNKCNFKCEHCYLSQNRSFSFMGIVFFKKIIDELYEMKCMWICLTGGEVFLHPDFIEMYLYARKKGFLITINSNGYLINQKFLDILDKFKPFGIEISLYGLNDNEYLDFTKIKKAFTRVNENIIKLNDIKINVSTKMLLMKNNVFRFKDYEKYAQKLGIHFRFDTSIIPRFNGDIFPCQKYRMSPIEIYSFYNDNKELLIPIKNKIEEISLTQSNFLFQCNAAVNFAYIDSQSNLRMCLMIDDPKFDLTDSTIIDSLKKFNKILNEKIPKDSDCFNCNKKSLCRYCPGRFFLETGSFTKKAEWYCDVAKILIEGCRG